MLLESLSPLIPYELGEPMKLDPSLATTEGKYWSKGLGESILIKFGKTAAIEPLLPALSAETLVRHVSYGPYSGFVSKIGVPFEDLPETSR
jgi:hypothetical protein